MNAIYLSRIELDNFRTFGDFSLDLPPVPGLTLLVGTNGLGKSSFFDGIEWCLTDDVRRFRPYAGNRDEADYLTRREAPAGSHRVRLEYSDGAVVARSAAHRPAASELVQLLKRPEWTEIGDVGSYLALTHFLGQAAQQRFTSRQGKDQWQALKGPSGVDRLEEIRSALTGSTLNAFKAREAREEQRVALADAELKTWQETRARLRRLREAGRLAGVPTREALAAVLNSLQDGLPNPVPLTPADLPASILAMRAALDTIKAGTVEAIRSLDGLRSDVEFHDLHAAAADPEGAGLPAAKAAVEAAVAAVSDAADQAVSAQKAVEADEEAAASAVAEINRLTQLQGALASRGRLVARLDELNRERGAVAARIAELNNGVEAARQRLELAEQEERRRALLAERRSALDEVAGRLRQVEQLGAVAAAAGAAADVAAREVPSLKAEADAAEAGIGELSESIVRSEARLVLLRRRASDTADALAKLAAHVEEHDTECPACSTVFAPGVLRRLVEAAASRENAELAEQTERHEGLVRSLDQRTAALAALSQRLAEAERAGVRAEAVRRELESATGAVALSLGIDPSADLAGEIGRRGDELDRSLAEIERAALADGLSSAAAREQTGALEADAALARRTLADLDRELASVSTDMQAASALLGGLQPVTEATLAVSIERQRRTLDDSRTRIEELRRAHSAALAREVSERQRLTVAQTEQTRRHDEVARIRDGLQARARRWTDAGLPGGPSMDALEGAIASLRARGSDIEARLERLGDVVRQHEAILEREDLAALERHIAETAGEGALADGAAHERKLRGERDAARAALSLTRSARVAVRKYATHLKSVADQFSTQFLKPLNNLIDNFNHALLTTPDESVVLNARHALNRTDLDMQVRRTDPLDEALSTQGLPPQLVLSEGQMAANGFSILCAASTAYPWSRWPALLLDDPLQHNDVIHAAAFVDVMRNLVEFQGYQLLMSSHERAEAEFLARKFDAAGLPCTVVNLTAPSRDGVRVDAPRYNGPARAALQQSLAKAV